MAVVFQVNGNGGANELEVSDDGTVKILNKSAAALFGTASDFIADPTGAVTDQDDEARTAIAAILDLLIAKGLMASS